MSASVEECLASSPRISNPLPEKDVQEKPLNDVGEWGCNKTLERGEKSMLPIHYEAAAAIL